MWPTSAPTTPEEVARALETLYNERGDTYYDESVTQTQHALQSAMLARQESAAETLVVAALLHDIGHLIMDEHAGHDDFLHSDEHHERIGAAVLAQWFPEAITQPIALHVAAKRYLVSTDPNYAATLSRASIRSLAVQGGPMRHGEAAAFRNSCHAEAACRLRRWDDRAKVAGQTTPPLTDYLPTIESLVRLRSRVT